VSEHAIYAFAAVALLASTVQTAVGFASTLLCATLGAHLLPIRHVVALSVLMSFVQTSYVVLRYRDGVRWRMLATRVLPWMALGAALGYLVVREIAGTWAELAFASMVTLLAARELVRLLGGSGEGGAIGRLASNLMIFVAGLVHGAYATGGPPLVYAVGRELPKHELRATLSVVWLVMDSALATSFLLDGFYTLATLEPLALVPLALPLGVLAGELAHRKVDERRFKIALFALLLLAGIAVVLR
jgi:uncharacterized membrane protein YfcA